MDSVHQSRFSFGRLADQAAERVLHLLLPKDSEAVRAVLTPIRIKRAKMKVPPPEPGKSARKRLTELRKAFRPETSQWWVLTSAIHSVAPCFFAHRWSDDTEEARWTAHRALHAASVAEFIAAEHRRIELETLLFSHQIELAQLRDTKGQS